MKKNVAVIRGDGIGPEIVNQALKVLDKVGEIFGHTFNYTDVDMGGKARNRKNLQKIFPEKQNKPTGRQILFCLLFLYIRKK